MEKQEVSEELLEQLKEQLRKSPELFESIAQIVELSHADGTTDTVKLDDVEQALIPKIRKLGQDTLGGWVSSMEEHSSEHIKESDSTIKQREKKR